MQLTKSVSLPPTMLRPSPILSLLISIVVSRPGLIGQVMGSETGSSDRFLTNKAIFVVVVAGVEAGNILGDGVAGFTITEGRDEESPFPDTVKLVTYDEEGEREGGWVEEASGVVAEGTGRVVDEEVEVA